MITQWGAQRAPALVVTPSPLATAHGKALPPASALGSPPALGTAAARLWDFARVWFTNCTYYRTNAVLCAERYLFFTPASPQFSRWHLVLPIFLVQMCVGSLYSFSIFNAKLDEVWGTPGANANAYLLCIAFYGLTTILFGVWVERAGPRRSAAVCLLLSPLGWGLAALGSQQRLQGLESLFLLHGIGSACAYISLTSTLARWFAEYKGLFTGIAVMGVGFGSFCWTSIGKALLDPLGPYRFEVWRVQGVFSLAILLVMALCVPLLRDPPPGYAPAAASNLNARTWQGALLRALRTTTTTTPSSSSHAHAPAAGKRPGTFIEALRSQEMLLLCAVFFAAEITGLVFLSSASDMVQNTFRLSAGESISVTSYLNLANFFGRVAWGFASDKLGRKNFFLLSTGVQALASGLQAHWIATQNFGGWLASFLVIGTLYGGGFGVIPALCSDLFGSHISAATHGIMIGVWASAAVVGIPIFTSITAQYSLTSAAGVRIPTPEAYIRNSWWLCALPTLGFLVCLLLNVTPADRRARERMGGVRARLGPWAVCWSPAGGAVLLGRAQLAVEAEEAAAAEAQDAAQALPLKVKEPAGAAAEAQPVLPPGTASNLI